LSAAFALISRRATMGQGVVMGLSNSFMSLGRIVGPIWAGFIFDVHVDYPYLSGSALMFLAFLLSLVWISQGVTRSDGSTPDSAADGDQPLLDKA
jgi:DHA1 family multidrug resistance protein-like MFS transporter